MSGDKKGSYQINLLGPWQVLKDGVPLTDFRGDSVRALFTYVLCESKSPQARRFLASLLWEDLDEEAAMRNVRVSLTRLKKGLDEDDKQPLLYVDRQSVGVDPTASYNLDTEQFEQAIAHARRSSQPGRPPDRRVLARLKRAIDLYRADFLQGFTHASYPFEDWMLVQRERYHNDALWALHTLTDHALRIQDWHTAADYAQRQINLEAWREEGFQQLMQAQLGLGQRTAAIASYEKCKQVLWDELGVEPDDKTLELYEQAKANDADEDDTPENPHNLSAAGSHFFSREFEIEFLLNRLGDPDGRLTTILGEGGVGKSRLSQYVGLRVLRDFKDGVWFVPLDHIEGESGEKRVENREGKGAQLEDEIVRLMIDTLEVPLAGNRSDREQLMGWLERKELLLILDNFEHVLPAAPLVQDMLNTADGVVIITTSREMLNLSQEVLLPLRGLDIAQADEEMAPAVRLFIDRAERVGAAFTQDESTLEAITKVCEMVGGNALAIELAAVWMRQMSAKEILEAVQESVDFLEARHLDIPARHRSMRAVFDQTWQLLPADAQQVLAQLSVFRGGFVAKAAQAVVNTNRKMLALLHDRSLIHRLASGRYEMRPLVREYAAERLNTVERFEMLGMVKAYAAEQLDEDQAKITLQAHADWFLKFMAEQKADLMGAKPWDAIERIELELENIRQAWRSGLSEAGANADALLNAAEPLSEYYNIRGRFQEAAEMFSLAAKLPTQRIPNSDRLVAHATMHKTRFIVRLGQYKDGAELGKQAVRLAKTV
ncbi:MAG: BTAD domain-containing putative transcriptional regulator, partial [Chloroflexota bacterium]